MSTESFHDQPQGANGMFRTTADWLDDHGIPPIVIAVVSACVAIQLTVIAFLLVRWVLQRRFRPPRDDYEQLGADYFLAKRAEALAGARARRDEEGSALLRRQARLSVSQPDLSASTQVVTKPPPTPSLRRYTLQPGTSVTHKGASFPPIASKRGVTMEEEETADVREKRALFRMRRSQSTPRNLYGTSLGCLKLGAEGSDIGAVSSEMIAAVGEQPPQHGRILFAVTYHKESEELGVFVERACQLALGTLGGPVDTYVKVSVSAGREILPSVSRVVRGSTDPEYAHNFRFRVAPGVAKQVVVKFQVFKLGSFSQNEPIGELEYHLSQCPDLTRAVKVWKDLEAQSKVGNVSMGEILFSLTYLPNAERLSVVVLKGRNLKLPSVGRRKLVRKEALDTFVKVTLVKFSKIVKYKQTRLCRKSSEPVYNEVFSMKLRQSDLDNVSLTLAVCVRLNHLGFHRVIGRCTVGRHVAAAGASHWQDMVKAPGSGVGQWHALH